MIQFYDVVGVPNLPGGAERRYTVLGMSFHREGMWVDVIDADGRWYRVPREWIA